VGFGGSISAGVTLKDGKGYFGCADHHLYCVDAKSGKEVWRFRANDVNDTSRPFIHEGIVYAGFFDGYMYALGERGGQMIWKFKTGDRITGTANGLGGLLVFGSWDGYIYGVNRKNGKEIWNFNTGERVAGSATVDGKRIYIGSRNGNLYCLDSEGKEVWSKTLGKKPFYDFGNAVCELVSGDILVLGTTKSIVANKNIYNNDICLIKLDSKGNVIEEKIFGGQGADWANTVSLAENSEIVVAGHTDSSGSGFFDMLLLKIRFQQN